MTEYRIPVDTNPDDLEPGASPFHAPPGTEITALDWNGHAVTAITAQIDAGGLE